MSISATIVSMVLATIMKCAILSAAVTPPNAADSWNDFFDQIQDMELPYGEQSSWGPTEQARYEELVPLIQQARSNAQIKQCDWELDYSQGLNLLLPHLSSMRQAGLLIQFSIQADVVSGNTASAIEGMDSIIGISQQSHVDKTVIGALVGYSAFSMTKDSMPVLDSIEDPTHLEAIQLRVDGLDPFDPFGLRSSIGHERDMLMDWFESPSFKELDPSDFGSDVDASSWDMDIEKQNYNEAMDRAAEIFAMEDEESALMAMKEWRSAIEHGAYGEMPKVLCPAFGTLLQNAFKASNDVAKLKEVVDKKMHMLQSPNAATYFLQAVEAYEALDSDKRRKAVRQGDFEMLELPLQLLAKAASMEPTRISLSDDPATPSWVAPLYALTLDGIARGTMQDVQVTLQVVAHLSQQDRFAASIAAASLFGGEWRASPNELTDEERVQFQNLIRRIPSADTFMLHASARSDTRRLAVWFEVEDDWKPSRDVVLATTLTLATQDGIAKRWPAVWPAFVDSLGVPDNDAVIKTALTTQTPETLLLVKLEQTEAFNEMLRDYRNSLARPR
jgi:hypothetical protein